MKLKKFLRYWIKLYFIYDIFNLVLFKLNGVNNTPFVSGFVNLKNNGRFILGCNVKINSGRKFNVIGGDTKTNIIINSNGTLIIGDYVGISNSTFVCYDSIFIGNDVLVGGSCKFYDSDFHSINVSSRIRPYRIGLFDDDIKTCGIVVKDGAWIGGHCIVLKGVTIGQNSIIAAGSVVSRNVPDNEIWGGNPIKFIRKI